MNNSMLVSRSSVEQKYTLIKESDMTFNAYLDLDFSFSRTLKKSFADQESTIARLRQKIKQCYVTFEGKLIDEMGRKIRLHLYDKDEHASVLPPPRAQIKLEGPDFRSHSRAYSISEDCSTFIHEAFHLLGLPDEYLETGLVVNPNLIARVVKPYIDLSSPKTAFNCRSHGPRSSIMRDSSFIYYVQHVLYSAHVDSIIYPNCKIKNNEYYSCVKNNYQTSRDRGGMGCKDVPDICMTKDWVKSPRSPDRLPRN